MCQKILILSIILKTLISPAYATEYENTNELSVNTTFFGKSFKYSESVQSIYTLTSENKITFNKFFELKLTPEMMYLDQLNFHDTNESHFEPKEAYLGVYSKNLSSKFGYFQMKKEGPDIFDPFDYQQPKNYLDVMRPTKLPLFGAKFEYEVNSYTVIEATYINKNKVPVVPSINNPWYPRENKIPTQSDSAVLNVPQDVQYKISENSEENDTTLKNNYIVKTKVQTNTLDFIFMFSETLSNTPTIIPTLTGTLTSTTPVYQIDLDNPVELKLQWKKVKNYGVGLIKPLERYKILTKFYFNQLISADDKINTYNLAFEKQFETVTFVLESSLQKSNDKPQGTNISNASRLFAEAIAIGLRYAPTDYFTLLVGGFNDLKNGSYYFTLNPKVNFTSSFYGELQANQLGGKKDSLLWYFDQNDSVSVKIGYLF